MVARAVSGGKLRKDIWATGIGTRALLAGAMYVGAGVVSYFRYVGKNACGK